MEMGHGLNTTVYKVLDLHLQTLLVEGVEDVGTQLAGQMHRVVARQEFGSIHGQVVEDEGADHSIDCTGTELLQEGRA